MRGRLEVSGFPDPDRRRAIKRLGRKVASSPRDSTAREHSLPWARCSIPANLRRVKDSPAPAPIRTAAAVACSRDVSAGSAPPVHRPVIAHQLASGRPGAGGAGRRFQSQRYRQQRRQRRALTVSDTPPPEGQRPATIPQDFSGCPCDRPGCYQLFVPSPRSPDQHFCSPACRQALRRVRQREVRRLERRRRGARSWRFRVRPPP